jgi:hypothetical protein
MRAVGQYRTEMPWHTVLTVARPSRLKDFQYPAGRPRPSQPTGEGGEMYVPGPNAGLCVSTVSIVCARDGCVPKPARFHQSRQIGLSVVVAGGAAAACAEPNPLLELRSVMISRTHAATGSASIMHSIAPLATPKASFDQIEPARCALSQFPTCGLARCHRPPA